MTKRLKLSKSAIGAVYAGIGAALVAGASIIVGGTNPTDPPGGTNPKWAIGDILYSHALANAVWTVKSIDYGTKRYGVDFAFAGTIERIFVDWRNLETSDIYKT